MSKHTPGPWKHGTDKAFVYAMNNARIRSNRFYAAIQPGWDDVNERVPHAEMLANARLIAAAPDLYKALQSLADLIETQHRGDGREPTREEAEDHR